jgi:hypothetical protein
MYKNWTDEELRKAQRQNRINFLKSEIRVINLFAVALLVYLAAEKGMWWLLCGGAGFLAVCVFVYSLCVVAGRADEQSGLQEWQQGGER